MLLKGLSLTARRAMRERMRWCTNCGVATHHQAVMRDVHLCGDCGTMSGPVEERLAEACAVQREIERVTA